ncbi:MAG: hypothetical protein V4683_01155 [Bacteroidota bacterium]
MKNIIVISFILLLASCEADKYKISKYYTDSERDTLLTNMITYVYTKAPGATDSTKWKPEFRSFYNKSLPSFHIENYFIAENGWHYYFMIRPVGGSTKRRGVIGKFKLEKGSLKPTEFEETLNTPHLDEEIVRERGSFLFKELVKNGDFDKYLTMKHYIQWPDSTLVYNKRTNNWEIPKQKAFAD